MSQPDANTVTSVEQDGRILSGVGVSTRDLEAVMERHAPPESKAEKAATPQQAEPPKADGTQAVTEPPKESKGRQRFSDLTKERDEAKARADEAAAKAAQLEKERDELKAKIQTPPAAPQQAAAVQPQQVAPSPSFVPPQQQQVVTRPQPSVNDIGTKYPTYEDFVADMSRWTFEQGALDVQRQIRQTIEQDRAAQAFQALVQATHSKARAAYPDFDEVYRSGPGGQVPMPMDRLQAIYAAPNSEHLQYVILKDPALAQKLATLPAIEFGMELAKLTTATPAASPASTGSVSGSVTPPPPYQPVGGNGKTTATPSAELVKKAGFDFDKSGYREKRAAERGVQGRRR